MVHWKRSDLIKKGLIDADPINSVKSIIIGHMVRLYIRAIPKPRMTNRDKWKKRDIVVRYFQYKDNLKSMLPQNYVLPDNFKITYIFEVPKEWSKTKQLGMIGMPHQQRPDLDNLHKGIMDALLKKDETVWHIDGNKFWGLKDEIIITKL